MPAHNQSIFGPRRIKKRHPLTDETREALRRRIQEVKPWLKSTGPRTFPGKCRSRWNAIKHGLYVKAFNRERGEEAVRKVRWGTEMKIG